MADLPSPLVDFVPTSLWFNLQEGPASVLQSIINITAPGTTQLPQSVGTFTSVYVNAAGAVTVSLPPIGQLVAGQRWTVIDSSGHADTNPITVSGNGNIINGATVFQSFQISFPYGSAVFEWNGNQFSLVV